MLAQLLKKMRDEHRTFSLTVLSPWIPYPPHSGGTAHIVGALRQLSHAYRIHLYALSAEPAPPVSPLLDSTCEVVKTFPRPRRPRRGLAPPAVYQERSPELIAYLRREWATAPPDLVQLEHTSMAQYVHLAREYGIPTVCTAQVVAFLAQIRRARRERHAALRARRWLGALSLWIYELRTLPLCDLVVTLSTEDAAELRRWLPRLPVAYVPSGVDLAGHPVRFNLQATDEVLFVGSYQHPPNVEGALWLAREVWPLVRRARPSACLTLAGRAPTSEIQALAANDIHIPGTLDDLGPLYARSSVMVAPIFWGSGVRIKILDSLAAGLPLVTTAAAAEGINLIEGESALFAERPEDFAAAIVRLLDNDALRTRLSAAGRAVIERDYDWERVGTRLIGLYEQA
ncbi:MAG TPA: glycosyltransferase family 4 protein, partial [Roseiflexaceae bacterium]|nr:glycosyltransferase family 4 protein [Roseiflexaceae bacterium]